MGIKSVKKSITKRIRVTKRGKVLRRAMALGHAKANKNTVQKKRKKAHRTLGTGITKQLQQYL